MSLSLDNVTKQYARQRVVNRVSLEVADGEFFVLIGPSGSGKSTVLRIIAGLIDPDEGKVILQKRDVTHSKPQEREIGFVFQSYALFGHMTVAQNVEFALQVRKVPAEERRARRLELLDMVGLAGFGERMPAQLSGGQQQRVALARALAHSPRILLLDEPFGALDARIRTELRHSLKQVQQELGMTTLFVTHDQDEAFELGDRIGVMNYGRLLEVGRPEELYRHPRTEFVATFLGVANLLTGRCKEGSLEVGEAEFPLHTEALHGEPDSSVGILFRPEDVVISDVSAPREVPILGQGRVVRTLFRGPVESVRVELDPAPDLRPSGPSLVFGRDRMVVEATRSPEERRALPLLVGQTVAVGVRRIHPLAQPAMRLLIVAENNPASRAAVKFGADLANLSHARVTLLADESDPELERFARESLGNGLAGLEVRSHPPSTLGLIVTNEMVVNSYDLLVLGHRPGHLLSTPTPSHVLYVPTEGAAPSRILLCAAGGEPSKEQVAFGGRLALLWGAGVTLLSIVEARASQADRASLERFLWQGRKTLELMGVQVDCTLIEGQVNNAIKEQMMSHDLLLLGAPSCEDDVGSAAKRHLLPALEGAERPTLVFCSSFVAPLRTRPRRQEAIR